MKDETWKQALADHTCHKSFEDMNTSEMEVAEFVAGTILKDEKHLRDIIKFVFMEAQKGGGYNKEAEDYFVHAIKNNKQNEVDKSK